GTRCGYYPASWASAIRTADGTPSTTASASPACTAGAGISAWTSRSTRRCGTYPRAPDTSPSADAGCSVRRLRRGLAQAVPGRPAQRGDLLGGRLVGAREPQAAHLLRRPQPQHVAHRGRNRLEQPGLHVGPPPLGDPAEERPAQLRHLGPSGLVPPRRALGDEQPRPLGVVTAPGHVHGHDGLDAVTRLLVAAPFGEERLLIHVQRLGIQDAEDVFLAGEVVVETTDADAALIAQARQRGGRDAVLAEQA